MQNNDGIFLSNSISLFSLNVFHLRQLLHPLMPRLDIIETMPELVDDEHDGKKSIEIE